MFFVSLSACVDFIDLVMCGLVFSANSRRSLLFNTNALFSFFEGDYWSWCAAGYVVVYLNFSRLVVLDMV